MRKPIFSGVAMLLLAFTAPPTRTKGSAELTFYVTGSGGTRAGGR